VLVHNIAKKRRCDEEPLPGLDGSNQIHWKGDVPSYPLAHWTTDDLVQLAGDLRVSIDTRKRMNSATGAKPDKVPAHSRRLTGEERLLRQIEKILSGT
jgi:hypothetical protein